MRGLLIEADEVVQILISVVAISFAFTIVLAGIGNLFTVPREFLVYTIISLVTVGSGFILHEMAHKLVALYYGAYAKFKMWTQGLLFMLATSLFLRVLFAAPGAVYIYSDRITRRQNGVISIAGPMVNIVIALVFMALSLFAPVVFHFSFRSSPLNAWEFGAQINLILGLFNMIPAFPLDGSKVYMWSRLIWVGTIIMFMALAYVLVTPFPVFLMFLVDWVILMGIALLFSKVAFG